MIYTSYYAKANKLDKNLKLISIARYSPRWMKIDEYKALAPTKEILFQYKEYGDIRKYIRAYKKDVLSKLSVDKVARDLDGCVLMCYEKSSDFCHRHIVSKWLQIHGYECKEI